MIKLFSDVRLGAEAMEGERVRFNVWAPFADAVTVEIVSPPTRQVPLSPVGGGYHQGVAERLGPGAKYLYRLRRQGPQGETRFDRRPDPASRRQPEGVHGPSQVVAPGFRWRHPGWAGLPLSRYIISEIHVGTFTPEGTFDGVAARLDRLRDAGFTAVELMPVAAFPGGRNWGYDGVYPFAVQESYGGPDGLKRLVDACHGAGLAVILDVVYNHLGPEGNYLREYGPYFTDAYRTPWGEAVNFDGPHSDAVRRFFIENALQWICDFRVDALRLDAVHAICDFSARPFLQDLATAVGLAAEALDRRVYCIAESARNDARIVRSRSLGGLGLDAQWNDDFHHCLHALLTGEQDGYYRDYGRLEDLAAAWRSGYVYTGQHSAFRQRRHGNSSRDIPARRFVVSAQNHDQVGNRLRGDRLSTLVSFEGQKLAAAVVLLSPFIPLLFMGEEYGETAPFPYFVSHTDPKLVEAVREGRRREFASFRWAQDPPDPQDPATFLTARPDPSVAAGGDHRILLGLHRELIRMRTGIRSLARMSKKTMQVQCLSDKKTLFVHRWSLRDEACTLFHFGSRASTAAAPIPGGRWRRRFDSSDSKWRGPGSRLPDAVVAQDGEPTPLPLAPFSAVLLTRPQAGGEHLKMD